MTTPIRAGSKRAGLLGGVVQEGTEAAQPRERGARGQDAANVYTSQ